MTELLLQGVVRVTERGQLVAGHPTGDQLLTNVMLYWPTGTAGSSADLYYENLHAAFVPRSR